MRALLAVLWLLVGSSPAFACPAVLPVPQAIRLIAGDDRPAAARTVRLPDRLTVAERGEAVRVRYRIDTTPCAAHPVAALWLFRVGAPYRASDDQGRPLALVSGGASTLAEELFHSSAEARYNGRIPALFALPAGTRHVDVELAGLPYIPSGLIRAELGPAPLLLPVQGRQLDQVVASADAASGVVLVLGAIALVLWLQRRSDRALLWLAIACGLWGVRGLVYFGPRVLLPPLVFEQFNPLSVLLASTAVTASVLSLLGNVPRRAWLWLAGGALLAATGLVLATLLQRGGLAARAWSLATGFAMITSLLVHVLRRRNELARWHVATLAGALAGLLFCATHDLLVVGGQLPPTEPSYVFWGFVAMLIGFATMSGQYVVATLNRAERSNEELERHVQRKTLELEASYARLRESEREAARTQERERLLRDMHDGLGAQLMTALRGVERGALAPQQVTQSLQDSLDELRLLMDSTDIGLYLPGALAAWRNRWDHRLAAAGVALQWRIDEALDAIQLPGDSALQVMRILQEAATNVVKHARATHLSLDAGVDDGCLRIAIRDDGAGLPEGPARTGARGLKNMRHRAGQIGGELLVQPGPEGRGTEVVLRVPLGAGDQATSPRRAASIAASARDEMPSLR